MSSGKKAGGSLRKSEGGQKVPFEIVSGEDIKEQAENPDITKMEELQRQIKELLEDKKRRDEIVKKQEEENKQLKGYISEEMQVFAKRRDSMYIQEVAFQLIGHMPHAPKFGSANLKIIRKKKEAKGCYTFELTIYATRNESEMNPFSQYLLAKGIWQYNGFTGVFVPAHGMHQFLEEGKLDNEKYEKTLLDNSEEMMFGKRKQEDEVVDGVKKAKY